LRQAEGVGPLTVLTFVLTVEDPYRFEKGRSVGAYLGLVPAQDQSGERDPQKHITKEGDEMLRKLLVSGAQYILGSFGTLGHTETATSALTKCAFSWKFAPYK
jgi:transposase